MCFVLDETIIRHTETFVKHFFVDFENILGYNYLKNCGKEVDAMNKRIKMIRESKDLTQDEFGKRIGSARNTIANYETGNRTPSNAVITSICREFCVNETWLKTGEGEMFLPKTIVMEKDLADLTVDLLKESSDSFKSRFISLLARMSDDEWEMLENLVEKLTKKE